MDPANLDTRPGSERPDGEAGVAPRSGTDPDRALWAEFADAASADAFCQAWLALQCRMIPGVRGGVLLLGAPDQGPFTPVAAWPEPRRSKIQHLAGVAERALRERQGLLQERDVNRAADPADLGAHEVAYPIQVEGRIHGVIALDLTTRSPQEFQEVLRRLHWGAAWIELLVRRKEALAEIHTKERLQTVLDLVATLAGETRFFAAATGFATDLATRLGCERVSVGCVRGGHVRIRAVSHSAQFGKHSNLIRAIGHAMDEALDQAATVVVPPLSDQTVQVTRAHEELGRLHEAGAICTVPLRSGTRQIGALTFERSGDRPFDAQTVEICEAIAAVSGPILEVQRREDRWLITKAADAAVTTLRHLVGPHHMALKLAALIVTGLVAFFALAQGDYRVNAKTVLEGQVLLAVVAPFDGYIVSAQVRAGDLVLDGQQVATLDDRELRLESLKWKSQHEQFRKEYNQALAQREAAQVEILSAQLGQARAQLALLEDKLSKTRLMAPMTGVVVTGDLSQSLGSPVERGEVLFEVAPLDAYRVILQVDERDIREVHVGQTGQLLLSSFPNEPVPFTVEKITPVSTAEEGRNYFRVEAVLSHAPDRLRPGMEGVGKIDIDRRHLIWIWTHEILDGVRLALWKWLP